MAKSLTTKKMVTMGFLANVLEWYDFSVYAFLATIIGQLFFDTDSKQMALIKALFLFTVSYLARPFGCVAFGYLSDRFGRSASLKISLLGVALPMFFIGLLPTYHDLGIIATLLLITLRLIQGLAAGGELPGMSCYLYEIAPAEKRTFFCSLVVSSSSFGVFLGSVTAFALNYSLSKTAILEWAWRLPFLFGAIIAVIIFVIRNQLFETTAFQEAAGKVNHFKDTLQQLFAYRRTLLQLSAIQVFTSVSFYLLFVWMPSYLNVFLHFPEAKMFLLSSVALLMLIGLTMLISYFATYRFRKALIIFGIVSILLLTTPFFLWLRSGEFATILLTQLVFAFCLGCTNSVVHPVMNSLYPANIRGTAMNITFTFPTAICGGIAPTLASWLIHTTGFELAPVVLVIGACLIALPAAMRLKLGETPAGAMDNEFNSAVGLLDRRLG